MNNTSIQQKQQVNNLVHNEKIELSQPNVNQAYGRLVSILDDGFSFSKLAHKIVKFFTNVKNQIFTPSQDQKIANLMSLEKKLTETSNQLLADSHDAKLN